MISALVVAALILGTIQIDAPPVGATFTVEADPPAFTDSGGVVYLLPAFFGYSLDWQRHILIHERTHSARVKAGTFDYGNPWEEERIATETACLTAPVPGCPDWRTR